MTMKQIAAKTSRRITSVMGAIVALMLVAAAAVPASAADVLINPVIVTNPAGWKHKDGKTSDYCIIDVSGGPTAKNYPVTYLTSPPTLNDEYKTTKIVLRKIPAGSFVMGSPTNELGWNSVETQHTVTLSSNFYMGVFEITQGQYSNVMGANPSYWPLGAHGPTRPVELVSWDMIRGGTWPGGTPGSTTFMGKLQSKTGLPFDLPTEAQWEYACRAGTTNALNNNTNLISTDQDPNMDILGRYWYNGGSTYSTNPVSGAHTTVGSYQVNNWGLYDMYGNVDEWCLDWYQSDLGTGAVTNPPGTATGSFRMMHGGSWADIAISCRSAARETYKPDYTADRGGFRLSLPTGQ